MASRFLCFLLLVFSIAGHGAEPPSEFTLDNGLKLIVLPDRRAPVVVSQIWYRVGATHEHDGITGISHALEHMMFKGTERYPAGEFSRIIAENGGNENAFTGIDYTGYYQQLERSRLAISFELEADRMRNLLLDPEEFAREIQVVMEERRLRTDDNPQALTYEQAKATAFITSPFRIPVIGWMADLEHMTVEDLEAWYERWYAPNNAIAVVVGDVDPEEVHALAKAHFGPLAPSDLSPPKPRPEIPQSGERRITVKAPAQLPYLLMLYKAPSLTQAVAGDAAAGTDEIFALEVLAELLDGGDSARLTRNLVRGAEVAASAGAGYSMVSRLESMFTFSGTPTQGRDVQELEAALRAEVVKLQQELVSSEELERVKIRAITSNIYQQDSMFFQAYIIGMLEAVGLDWRWKDKYVDGVRAVTAEQVREVARKYLNDDQLTVAVLEPLPLETGRTPPAFMGGYDNVVH